MNAGNNRPLPGRHGDQACADLNLVAPLAGIANSELATDKRKAGTAGNSQAEPCAVSGVIGASLRHGDVDSANERSTRATATTPGARTSATATRTTTTRTTSSARVQSADSNPLGHAGFLPDLHLHLTYEYFDQIKSGIKTHEFRLCSKWAKRLEGKSFARIVLHRAYPPRHDTASHLIRPWLGMERRTITHPHFGPLPVEVFAIRVN